MEALLTKCKGVYQGLSRKGFLFLLFSYGLVQILSLVQRVMLARLLSPEDFARINLLQEGITAFASFATLAIPFAMSRFALMEENPLGYGRLALRFVVSINLLLLGGYYLVRDFFSLSLLHDGLTQDLLDILLLAAPVVSLYILAETFLTMQKFVREKSKMLLLSRGIMFICLITGAFLLQTEGAAAGIFLAQLCVAWIVYRAVTACVKVVSKKEKTPAGKEVSSSLFIRFVGFESVFYLSLYLQRLLLFFLSERMLTDLGEIAYLSVAFGMVVFISLLYASSNETFFPHILDRKNFTDCKHYLLKVNGMNIGFSVLLFMVAFFIFPYLIILFFGEAYKGAIPVFQVVCLGEIVSGISLLNESMLRALHIVKLRGVLALLVLALFIASMWYFVPQYGVMGTAYAFLFACSARFCFSAVLLFFFFTQERYETLRNNNESLSS